MTRPHQRKAAIAFANGTPAITLGNTIYINNEYYSGDYSTGDIGLLAHETTHEYQYADTLPGGIIGPAVIAAQSLATGGSNAAYDISKVRANTNFNSLGYEQQAQVVETFANDFKNQSVPDALKYGNVLESANPQLLSGGLMVNSGSPQTHVGASSSGGSGK